MEKTGRRETKSPLGRETEEEKVELRQYARETLDAQWKVRQCAGCDEPRRASIDISPKHAVFYALRIGRDGSV